MRSFGLRYVTLTVSIEGGKWKATHYLDGDAMAVQKKANEIARGASKQPKRTIRPQPVAKLKGENLPPAPLGEMRRSG
jgi:hypothetical protein